MSRSITLAALATVAAGISPLPVATAQAQQFDTQEAITVTAPYKRQTGRSATGAPIETMIAQSVVYYGDLNLATAAGRDELKNRVADAAESACKWLGEVFPPGPTTTPATTADCTRDAVARAQGQVNDVLRMGG